MAQSQRRWSSRTLDIDSRRGLYLRNIKRYVQANFPVGFVVIYTVLSREDNTSSLAEC
jgi:hypothetical protein